MTRATRREITGKQKAALLLVSLGPETSAQVFKHLSEEEIEQLTLEIANIRKVDSEQKEAILKNFMKCVLPKILSHKVV